MSICSNVLLISLSFPDGTIFMVVVCEVLKLDDVTGVVFIQSYVDHYFIQDDHLPSVFCC